MSDDTVLFINGMCSSFGVNTTIKILLFNGFFIMPKTVIEMSLCLKLHEINTFDFRQYFRFSREEVRKIISCLRLPDVIVTPHHKDRVQSFEAVCIVLRRLSYPNRLFDLQNQFGRHESALCRIFYCTMSLIVEKVKRGILFYNATIDDLNLFARAYNAKGVPNCLRLFAVVDAKKHQICRPSIHQQSMYSGHKKVHCVKYQTLEAPNGLFLHCSQGDDGRRGDAYVMRRSGLIDFLR